MNMNMNMMGTWLDEIEYNTCSYIAVIVFILFIIFVIVPVDQLWHIVNMICALGGWAFWIVLAIA